jgi:catechol 2,3-dioxygenase-like lactoylglutathione lyase family enzyme
MASMRYLVHDVDAAIDFYVGQLGFALEQRWGPPFAILARDGIKLWLSGPGSSASRLLSDGQQPAPGGWNRLVLEVENVASLVDRLRAAGIRTRSEIVSGPGGSQILVEDPSGNPVELFQPG